MNNVDCMQSDRKLEKPFVIDVAKAMMTALLIDTYILNRCPTAAIPGNRAPTEYWAGAEGFLMQGVYMDA